MDVIKVKWNSNSKWFTYKILNSYKKLIKFELNNSEYCILNLQTNSCQFYRNNKMYKWYPHIKFRLN